MTRYVAELLTCVRMLHLCVIVVCVLWSYGRNGSFDARMYPVSA